MVSSGLLPLALVLISGAVPVQAASITWVGGTANWADNTGTASWSPADEPDSDDTAVFNTDDLVTLTTGNTIVGLTTSGSITVDLNGNSLTVAGLTTLTGTGTRLELPASSVMTAQDITINSGGTVFIDGGSLNVSTSSAATNAVLATAAGGTLSGNGTITMSDVLAATTNVINNNGDLTASNPPSFIFNAPAVATLHLLSTDVDGRIDLDGSGEAGAVTVSRNQTLDIDLAIADIFNGSISMFQNSKLDIAGTWILGSGTINIESGSSAGIPTIPAGTAIITGGNFSQNGGNITVVDTDGTLQFDTNFSLTAGTLTNNGHVIFNQTATISAAANLAMVGDADLTVGDNHTLTINQTNFNFDGSNTSGTVITVGSLGLLTLNCTDYDSDSVTNSFEGTINLNDGDITVMTGDAKFVMNGTLNASSTINGQLITWNGEPLDIGNDSGSLDANLNISGSFQTQLVPDVTFKSDADVDVAAGATLALLGVATFDTVNAANNAEFTGAGRLLFTDDVNVNEAVTLNMVGGEVDLDGLDAVGDFINIDAPLTINAGTMASFGRSNGGGGVNTLDINNSVGTGVLTVNLDSPTGKWVLNGPGVMNLVNDNNEATLLAGSAVGLNGAVNVTGDVRSTARLDIAGTVNIGTSGQPLRLGGGGTGVNANTIAGATISGLGLLGADTGKELHGYGTINSSIDFDGTANLYASGGTLTLGSIILDVNVLGTLDDTGILHISQPWETDGGASGSIGSVVLAGGTLEGLTITNDNINGIQGHGTIKPKIINTSKITASNGGTLLLDVSGNGNDWDGAANTGELHALSADMEIKDLGSPSFGGKVTVANGRHFYTNGFGLGFTAASSLELSGNALYQAGASTDFGGTVLVNSGASATIQVGLNYFTTFKSGSTTTLSGNLQVVGNNIIVESGATFNGNGTLTVPDNSHIVMDAGSNANVLLDLKGGFRPCNSQGIGQCTVKDLQMAPTTELYTEIIGTGLNQYDRVSVNGIAVIDGYLNLDIDEVSPGVPFIPQLGDKFNILSATGGVTGRFKALDTSGMPAGLTFKVNYLPTIVQVEVISGREFETWINLFPSITDPADRLRTADPDHDGQNNLVEFALDGDPTSGKPNGKVVTRIATVGGVKTLTMTFPARYGNTFYDPPGGEFHTVGLTTPYLHYKTQASSNLSSFGLTVDQVTGADETALKAGMPTLSQGWLYVTCRSAGSVAADPRTFMRLDIYESGTLTP